MLAADFQLMGQLSVSNIDLLKLSGLILIDLGEMPVSGFEIVGACSDRLLDPCFRAVPKNVFKVF